MLNNNQSRNINRVICENGWEDSEESDLFKALALKYDLEVAEYIVKEEKYFNFYLDVCSFSQLAEEIYYDFVEKFKEEEDEFLKFLKVNKDNEAVLKKKLLDNGWMILDSVAIGLNQIDCKIYNLLNSNLESKAMLWGYNELLAFSSMIQADTGIRYLFADGGNSKFIILEDYIFNVSTVGVISYFYDTEKETYSIQLCCNKDHTGKECCCKSIYSNKDKLIVEKVAKKVSILIDKKLEAW